MKKLSLLLILTVLSACNPKKSGVNAVTTSGLGVLGNYGISTSCVQGSQNYGTVFEQSQVQYVAGDATGSFEDRVKALLSATMLPQDVGSISGQVGASTGIRFTGTIKLDANGNVIGTQSKLTISIYDSIWATNQIYNPSEKPIELAFDTSRAGHSITGQFNKQTGAGVLIARDSYGEVRLEGSINAQTFSGMLKWQNTTSVVGSATKGTIGNFTAPRCAVIQ